MVIRILVHFEAIGDKKTSMNPFVKELSELEIRRGAGLLTSTRRLGPEFARRLYTFFVSDDFNQIID